MIEMIEQRSNEWFAARIGKVTASKVADVIAKTQDELKLAYKVAYSACDGDKAWQIKVIAAKDEAKAKL